MGNEKKCHWCGKPLDVRRVDDGENIREICARCGYKLREFKKPVVQQPEQKPSFVEILPEEKPNAREKPIWPYVIGGIALIALIIALVKIFLL
ncbi:zinc ribbon domain-containing protein [Candidatus Pacearchaeota archaeon]|nr:zinc ribbon domain-containing protein [Candidatus Pacearchaeota archaeon]